MGSNTYQIIYRFYGFCSGLGTYFSCL